MRGGSGLFDFAVSNVTGSVNAWMLSDSCVALTPTPLFQRPGSQPLGQRCTGRAADGQ